jgi:glutaminase
MTRLRKPNGVVVAVVPGRFAIATFSARLSAAGNSVRGVYGPNPE